jgi:kynurenine formamidase
MSSLVALLKAARVYDLEQPRFAGMPIHASHRPGYFYALHRRHRDNYRPAEHGPRSGASGVLTMMEHSGTHIDALCHQACDLELYGGVATDTCESAAGFSRHGVETVPPLLARGVLIDVASHKRVERLPEFYSITADDLAAACQCGVRPGDVLLVRTGFGAIWNDEPAYLRAAGMHKSATLWAAERGVIAVGADNMTWDNPQERDPETGATLFAHVYLLPKQGIYILENLALEELARDGVSEFAFVCTPLKFNGATGSPVRPLALV